jgi:hypothetical protein
LLSVRIRSNGHGRPDGDRRLDSKMDSKRSRNMKRKGFG